MKCTCVTPCFVKGPSGRNTRFNSGQVVEFKKCPTHFKVLREDAELDLATASEEELMASKLSVAAITTFLEGFGLTLKNKKGSKKSIVAQILDARERNEPEDQTPPRAE